MTNLKLRGTIIRDLQEIEKMVKTLPQLKGSLSLEYAGVSTDEWDETIDDLPFEQDEKYRHFIYINKVLVVLLLR